MKENLIVELYTYRPELVEYAKKFVSECEAEDLVQDFFMNLLSGKINPEKIETLDELKKYAYVCIKHLCIDHIRHNKAKNNAVNNSRIENVEYVEQYYIQQDIVELISTELKKLSLKHKEIFFAHHFDGFSVKEIADRFELKPRTVESYLYRTLCYLRERRLLFI
jgi:RNA polymerase sigma-70 factor (ECF subfamily)